MTIVAALAIAAHGLALRASRLGTPALRPARLSALTRRPRRLSRALCSGLAVTGRTRLMPSALIMPARLVRRIERRRSLRVIESLRLLPYDAAADEPFQGAQFGVILVGHKRDRIADLVRATSAADAVDVILHLHRKIVVHHMRNAVHVNAPRRDVCRDEHAHRASLKSFNARSR